MIGHIPCLRVCVCALVRMCASVCVGVRMWVVLEMLSRQSGALEAKREGPQFFQAGSPPVSLQCTAFLNHLFPAINVTM